MAKKELNLSSSCPFFEYIVAFVLFTNRYNQHIWFAYSIDRYDLLDKYNKALLDTCPWPGYIMGMIKSFRHKGLEKLYETGSLQGVRPEHGNRLRLILARLDASQTPQDMRLPGLNLHPLRGDFKGFWAVSVSGNWRVLFRFEDNNAVDVNYLDYH